MHPRDDAHRVEGEVRPSQRVGQPRSKEEPDPSGDPEWRSRGADARQASPGETSRWRDPHHRLVQQKCTGHGSPMRRGGDARLEGKQSWPVGDHNERKKRVQQDLVPGAAIHHGGLRQADGSARHAELSSHRDRKDHQRGQR